METTQVYKDNIKWLPSVLPLVEAKLTEFRKLNKPTPDLSTVLAVIKQESGGDTWAIRYEPDFKEWLVRRIGENPQTFGAVSKPTELIFRSSSFGLGQVMGQVLREMGFRDAYLTKACDPDIGVHYCILKLSKLMETHSTLEKVLASYNAGSPIVKKDGSGKFVNQEYVDSVKRFKAQFESLKG